MYGFDGNCSALQWAEEYGLDNVNESDRDDLILQGYFTPSGDRTDKKVGVEIS